MIQVIIDTNIAIDCLALREPFCTSAKQLILFAYMGDYGLWMSTAQLPALEYVLSRGKKTRAADTKKQISGLHRAVHFCSLSEHQAEEALLSDWEDLEDAFIYQAALGVGADVIVTRNKQDFERSSIPVMDVPEFFAWMNKNHHVAYGTITSDGIETTA